IDAVITGTNNKCQSFVDIRYLTIRYIPINGTLGSLEVLDFGNEVLLQADTITDYDGITIYNPKRFKLTTREGTVYVINSETGIESITDQYGHTISYDDAGIHHSSGVSIAFERGVGNRIERIKDPQGRTIEYHYDEEGYLEKIVQNGGMTGQERIMAQYSYAGEGKSLFGDSLKRDLRKIIAPDGTELGQFEYDASGRMTGLIDANGNRVIYGYDVPNHRQTITDRLGNVTTYTYDNKGNVTSKTDPLGNLIQWEYDDNDNMIRETLPNGAVNVKTYNAAGDVLTETDALGNTTSYTYDAAGRMLTKTDALGRVYTTERDVNGNPVKEYGPLGDTIWSTYDAEGNLVTQKGMNGVVSAFAYNESGLVINTETYMQDDPNNILSRQETEYDSEGRPVRSVQYVNVGEPDEGMIVTHNEYDDWGSLIRDINPSGTSEFRYDGNGQKFASANHLGQWTHYVYNDQGKLIKTILPDEIEDNDGDPADPLFDSSALEDNPFTASTYDAEGRILTNIDMFGNVTMYEYDANGNRIKTIHPDGTQSMQVYDSAGNVIAMVDLFGNVTSYEHDLMGRQTVRMDALGYQWTTQYDAVGNRIASIDPVGRITEYKYDEADRLIQTIYPDGFQTNRTYDIHGNVTSETDQAGRTTWMSYDELNRLVEVRQLPEANTNDMAVTNYEYDKQGRKVAQIDALGRRTTWTYDIYGRVISRTLPEGETETFTYLSDGRKESHTDFNGQVTTYNYDNKGRLIGTHWMDGVNDNIPDISYQYDSTGRIIEAAKGSVTVQYIYDNIQKSLASLIYPGIGRIDYEYDPLGRRIGLTTVTGTAANPRMRRIDYSFDPLSRIQSVTSAHGTTLYRYDEVGNQIQMITTDGIEQLITTYVYDHLNRITSINLLDTIGNKIASYNYTLDPSGMVMDIMENGSRTVSYTYDNLARLLTETVSEIAQPNKTWTFAYDKVGNRTSQVKPDGEVITYLYDDNDRLLTETSNVSGLTTFSYNDNGDLTGMDSPTETATYSYDPVGRLIAAQVNREGNLLNTMYEYDHNNNRIRSIVTDSSSTQDISMLVDPTFQFAQVLEEQDAAGNLVASYTYGNDLLAQQRPEGLSYYHHDRIGSVRMLTTINGSPVNDYTYEAYGSTLAETATINNNYKYTGEQLIPELGWYYLRARNYNPTIGRFTSVDPVTGVMTQPLTLNKYGYTEGRPTTYTDPSGEFVLGDLMLVNYIWGLISESLVSPGYFAQKGFYFDEWKHIFKKPYWTFSCDIYGLEPGVNINYGFGISGGEEFLLPDHCPDEAWMYVYGGFGFSVGMPNPLRKFMPSFLRDIGRSSVRGYSGKVWGVRNAEDYKGDFYTVWARSILLRIPWVKNWIAKNNIPLNGTIFWGMPNLRGEFPFGYLNTDFTTSTSLGSVGASFSYYFYVGPLSRKEFHNLTIW
ncbi:MAG: RHS repeat-associated core domain-containing protein, partial [bacterium]